jgi:hypothetical protein
MKEPKRMYELLIRLEEGDLGPEQTAELSLLLESCSEHGYLLKYLTLESLLRHPQIQLNRLQPEDPNLCLEEN